MKEISGEEVKKIISIVETNYRGCDIDFYFHLSNRSLYISIYDGKDRKRSVIRTLLDFMKFLDSPMHSDKIETY